MQELNITVYEPDQVTAKMKFNNSPNMLDKKFKRSERVIGIDDPEGTGKQIFFKLRGLTGAENASLHQSALSKDDIQTITDKVVDASKNGDEIQTDDITNMIVEKMGSESQSEQTEERFLRKIAIGVVAPKGITVDRLRNWNPSLLEQVHDIIEDLETENDLWVLRSVPENQEQADKEIAELDINKA